MYFAKQLKKTRLYPMQIYQIHERCKLMSKTKTKAYPYLVLLSLKIIFQEIRVIT